LEKKKKEDLKCGTKRETLLKDASQVWEQMVNTTKKNQNRSGRNATRRKTSVVPGGDGDLGVKTGGERLEKKARLGFSESVGDNAKKLKKVITKQRSGGVSGKKITFTTIEEGTLLLCQCPGTMSGTRIQVSRNWREGVPVPGKRWMRGGGGRRRGGRVHQEKKKGGLQAR